MLRVCVVGILAALASGCSLVPADLPKVPERADAISRLEQATPCCTALAELAVGEMGEGFKEIVAVQGDEQVFPFKSGKSFVEAFKLPANRSGYAVILESYILDDAVLAPNVMLLNSRFEAIQGIPANAFVYLPAEGFMPDRLAYTLNIPPELGASYLVVFTTTADLAGTTEYIHPARAYAIAQDLADPGIPNPLAKHSPVGLLEVKVEGTFVKPVGDQGDVVDAWLAGIWGASTASTASSGRSTAEVEGIARAVPDSSSPVIAPAAMATTAATVSVASAAPGTMMAETEAMYNQMITQAVSGRDIDKAMKLVEEAERAGSATARKTFVEEVKKLK